MNKAKNGTVKVGNRVRLSHPEREDIYEDFVVVAVNKRIEKDDIRVIPLKALFACRAVTAADLQLLESEDDEEPQRPATRRTAATNAGNTSAELPEGGQADGNPPEVPTDGKPPEVKLREDGPTLEAYLKGGYKEEGYPPAGYAAKDSPGYQKLIEKRKKAAQS